MKTKIEMTDAMRRWNAAVEATDALFPGFDKAAAEGLYNLLIYSYGFGDTARELLEAGRVVGCFRE